MEETQLENTEIMPLGKLLKMNLMIPNYQRPYRWSGESAGQLFKDIYSAWKSDIKEYRIGSVILHKDGDNYNIVDGQQRVTTLSILTYCFYKQTSDEEYKKASVLLNKGNAFNELSNDAIIKNYEILKSNCKNIKSELRDFANYVFKNCTFVKIVTESVQEAFQFFDSQNSRGKALDPQDLLKSYHLREMNSESEESKIKIIEKWENQNQKKLAKFFEDNLYPAVRWYKNQGGLYYSTKKIKTFKGIKQDNNFHFALYHKAANLYIEQFNQDGMYELTGGEKQPQFQLTQPLIAGRRFFEYSLYYFELCKKLTEKIESKYGDFIAGGTGNRYLKNLFVNAAMFFADKFSLNELTENRLDFLFKWAFSLRLVMYSVYAQTVNNYALGKSDRINSGLNLFSRIAEMQNPEELDNIILKKVDKPKNQKYQNLWNKIFGEEDDEQ